VEVDKISLKPYIEGGLVKKIEVVGNVIPARNNGVKVSELPVIIEAFETIMKYFDLESVDDVEALEQEWSKKEIIDFLENRNERQFLFFRILSENDEIDRESLIEKLAKELKRPDFNGRNLAGSLGGIGTRLKTLEKESLYEKEWREEDGEWVCYYKLLPSYAPIIKEYFEEE
jgi:hypothetical protein